MKEEKTLLISRDEIFRLIYREYNINSLDVVDRKLGSTGARIIK